MSQTVYSVNEQGGGPFNTHMNSTGMKSRNIVTVDITNKDTMLSSSHSYVRPSVIEQNSP